MMDPRTKREKILDDLGADDEQLPLEDPDDGWEDETGGQHETTDGMD